MKLILEMQAMRDTPAAADLKISVFSVAFCPSSASIFAC